MTLNYFQQFLSFFINNLFKKVAVMVVAEFESQHRNSSKQLSRRAHGSMGNVR